MKVSLVLSVLLLVVLIVNHAEAGQVGISTYGDVSSHGVPSLKKTAIGERIWTDRAISSGRYQSIYDANSGIRSYQNSLKTPKYIVYSSNNQAVYHQQPSRNVVASDRSVPGEAYGGTIYKILKAKQEKRKGYKYNKPNVASPDYSKTNPSPPTPPPPPPPTSPPFPPPLPPPPPPSSITPPLIAGPTPLPSTSSDQQPPPMDGIISYLPPAVGPTDTYLPPPSGSGPDTPYAAYLPPSSPEITQPKDMVPQDLPVNGPPMDIPDQQPPPMDGIISYLPPAAGPTDTYLPPPSGSGPDTPYAAYLPPSSPEVTQPKDVVPQDLPVNGPPMDIPFDFHEFEHHHPHDHLPEYIFDEDHDHDHHHDYHHDHHDEPPPPPPTTPAPPPPPAKKSTTHSYNYYYISTFLWNTPLYASIYLSFYLLVLLLRGIGRHVVRYANDYKVRSFGVSSALEDMQFLTNDQASHKADVMAQFVMKQIEDFKQKYLR